MMLAIIIADAGAGLLCGARGKWRAVYPEMAWHDLGTYSKFFLFATVAGVALLSLMHTRMAADDDDKRMLVRVGFVACLVPVVWLVYCALVFLTIWLSGEVEATPLWTVRTAWPFTTAPLLLLALTSRASRRRLGWLAIATAVMAVTLAVGFDSLHIAGCSGHVFAYVVYFGACSALVWTGTEALGYWENIRIQLTSLRCVARGK